MELAFYLYFFIALLATFLGALPFGAINLSVVNITINKNFQKGFQFSLAASAVEILEAMVAILFGSIVQMFLEENSWIQILVFSIFIGLGLYNIFRVTRPKLGSRTKLKVSEFMKGFAVALANPQALPFWIFVLAFLAQEFALDLMGVNLIWFLTGVFVGKLLALALFGYMSTFLKSRLSESCTWINRTFGFILLAIGLFQAYQFFA